MEESASPQSTTVDDPSDAGFDDVMRGEGFDGEDPFADMEGEGFGDDDNPFANMSLEELMNVHVGPVGSLTAVDPRLVPATVTTITKDQIWHSGARSINELIDIYVPNFQIIRHHWEPEQTGLRGLISQHLYRVNGRLMNDRTHFGSLTERDLSLMGDIQQIDVVRGPGSATYGPGAIAAVINVTTENALTFQGTEIITRIGGIEEFYALEAKHAFKSDEDTGLYLYFGIEKYEGADNKHAPLSYGSDFTTVWGDEVNAGFPVPYSINDDNEAWRGKPRMKAHMQLNMGDLEFWVRFTKGGKHFSWSQKPIAPPPAGYNTWSTMISEFTQQGYGYQQLTIFGGYNQEISPELNIDYALSFDMTSSARPNFDAAPGVPYLYSHREDELYARTLVQWDPNANHHIAVGFEWSHEWFGRKAWGYPHDRPTLYPFTQYPDYGIVPKWEVDTVSFLGEYQWNISDEWTTFLSGRLDTNRFYDWLFSPRVVVIYTPTDVDTFKLIAARSVRMTLAEEQKSDAVTLGRDSDAETLDTIEFRYDRQLAEGLMLGLGAFYEDLTLISWDPAIEATGNIGSVTIAGFEAELTYQNEQVFFTASHGYSKMIDFTLEPTASTTITAEPYGYGDDLANWSNHITKLVAGYQINDQWRADTSMRIYWGLPGAKDYANYLGPTSREPGYDDPYGISAFFNLGLEYSPCETMTFRVDGYNILGVIDNTLNSRMFGFSEFGAARAYAPAIAVSAKMKF